MSTVLTNNFTELATGDTVGAKYLVYGSAKAWASVNGVSSPASVDNSLNIASIVDNGVGDYTLNFTNNMTTSAFAPTGMSSTTGQLVRNQARTAGSLRVQCVVPTTGDAADASAVGLMVLGALA